MASQLKLGHERRDREGERGREKRREGHERGPRTSERTKRTHGNIAGLYRNMKPLSWIGLG